MDITQSEKDEMCPSEEEWQAILLNIQEHYRMMEQVIKNQIEVKDEMIDKLHKELEMYKKDSASKFENQLLKQVIKIRKNLKRVITSARWDSLTMEEIRREYMNVYDDLTDLLILQDVDEFETKPGEVFDAAIHQAKIEVTEYKEDDKKIMQSLSEGYMKGNKLFIAERVVAYQYKEKEGIE